MNITYLVHQAERPRTPAERRGEAVRSGELAMALSRVLRGRRHAGGAGRAARPTLTLVRKTVPAQPGPGQVPDSRECRPAC
jgi:hypothetical protein